MNPAANGTTCSIELDTVWRSGLRKFSDRRCEPAYEHETGGGSLMLTFVFLAFIALFAISGVFISIEARRDKRGRQPRPMPTIAPSVGRATSEKD